MAIATSSHQISYAGNASIITSYAIPFRYLTAQDLEVWIKDAADVLSLLSPGSYYVTDTPPGGYILTASAVPVTSTVIIARVTPLTQPEEFPLSGAFDSRAVETGLDRVHMQLQEETGKSARSSRVPLGETAGGLQPAAERANMLYQFDGNGDPLMTDPDVLFGATITAAEEAAAASAAAAAAAATAAAESATSINTSGVLLRATGLFLDLRANA